MPTVDEQSSITIDAPPQKVWDAIADPAKQEDWNLFVSRITGQHALNATRAVTGLYGKAEGTSEERCLAYEAGRKIAWLTLSDSNGFSGRMASDIVLEFTVADAGAGKTTATLRNAFEPRKLFKLMTPVVRGPLAKKNQSTLRALKGYVETGQRAPKGK